MKSDRRIMHRKLAWAGFFLFLVVIGYYYRIPLLQSAGRFLDNSDPIERTEYALVLAGGNETRPFAAAALIRGGFTQEVLLTKVKSSRAVLDGLTPPSHEVSRRVLLLRGVAESRIQLLPDECTTTYDEAVSLRKFLVANPAGTIAVVTTDFHTRRASWAFKKVLGARLSNRIRFVSAPANGFSARDWWRTETGFTTYADEFGKLCFYFVYYNTLWCGFLVCGLVLSWCAIRILLNRTPNPKSTDKAKFKSENHDGTTVV